MLTVLGMIAKTTVAHAGENEGAFFLKLPMTSFHYGDAQGYKFNQHNFGVGVGYEHKKHLPVLGDTEVAYSLSHFADSYRCTATNLQVRVLKEAQSLAFGFSVNVAHKCLKPDNMARTFVAPLLNTTWIPTKSIKVSFDGFPPVSKEYGVAFVGVSVDIKF